MIVMATPPSSTEFLERVAAHDREGATGLVLGALDGGMTVDAVIESVLAPAQAEAGRRWETGVWTIAHEHAATAICQATLDAIAQRPRPASSRARVALACGEAEWHSLAANMFAELLRERGHEVIFLGAALGADHLNVFLQDLGAVALLLSCSVAMNLPGAARVIDAAHAVGCPVLAGGSGFGPTSLRADRIGADGWAIGPSDASELICEWARISLVGRPAQRPLTGEHVELAIRRDSIVMGALKLLTDRFPAMRDYDERQLGHTRADLGHIVDFLEAAVLTGDDTVFGEFLDWLARILRTVGVPEVALLQSLDCLCEQLPSDSAVARRLLRRTLVASPAAAPTRATNGWWARR